MNPITVNELRIGKTYTFNTVAPGILGVKNERVKLKSVMDFQSALAYERVDIKHRQVQPYMPSGSSVNPEDYIYFLFETEAKGTIVVSSGWIDFNSITEVSTVKAEILIQVENISDIDHLRDLLNAAGHTGKFTITIK